MVFSIYFFKVLCTPFAEIERYYLDSRRAEVDHHHRDPRCAEVERHHWDPRWAELERRHWDPRWAEVVHRHCFAGADGEVAARRAVYQASRPPYT